MSEIISRKKEKYTENKLILSIGLIIKNEEKNLEKCLVGLKPLLDGVKSELVIVDTGSTDKSIEIAKKYTNKVYHFDWIDDFSAARNFGLRKCSGEWFMYIDADEHFEDASELVEFFKNKDINKNYNSASYLVRSYESIDGKKYSDFYPSRISRINSNLHFVGAIHEYLKNISQPCYFFKTYAGHYGYLFSSKEEMLEKSRRNYEPLVRQLKKNPDDLKILWHIIDVVHDKKEKELYCERILKIVRNKIALNDLGDYVISSYFKIVQVKFEGKEYETSIKISGEIITQLAKDDALLGELYALRGMMLYFMKKYDEAEFDLKKCFEYKEKHAKGELNLLYLSVCITDFFLNNNEEEQMREKLADSIARQHRTDEAIAVYDYLEFDTLSKEMYEKYVDMFFEFTGYSIEYTKFIEICDKINLSCNDSLEKINYLNLKLEEKLLNGNLSKRFKPQYGDFAKMLSLLESPSKEEAEKFINKFDPIPRGFSISFFIALYNNIDLTKAIKNMNFESLCVHIDSIASFNSEFAKHAIRYMNNDIFTSTVKNLTFALVLFEKAVTVKVNLNSIEKNELYSRFTNYSKLYAENVLNPMLFNDEDISSLKEIYRFGFYMAAAEKELQSNNFSESLKILEKALNSCEVLKHVVLFHIQNLEKKIKL